jgi:hypothetical protein
MRSFRITYHDIANDMTRKTIVGVSKESGNIGRDAHAAVNIFISCVGNLKKFDILEIQELDKDKNPIGEPITPVDNSTMIPIKK